MRLSFYLLFVGALAAQAPRPAQVPPRIVQRLNPEYTAAAQAAGLEGTAFLYVEIDEEGSPVVIHMLQGLGMGLDEKALRAVALWRFQPATPGERRDRVGIGVELPFRLPTAGPWRVARSRYQFNEADRKPDPGSTETPLLARPFLAQYVRPDAASCGPESAVAAVAFVVTKDGGAKQARLVRGAEGAAGEAAVRAVESWQFQPGTRNGKPVAVNGEVELACGAGNPTAEPPSAVRIGPGVSPPSLRFKIEPEYSEDARRARYQGSVTLALEVGPDGYAHNIRTLRMLGLGLDEKAVDAVRQWRFAPGLKDGAPVLIQATIEVNFRLL